MKPFLKKTGRAMMWGLAGMALFGAVFPIFAQELPMKKSIRNDSERKISMVCGHLTAEIMCGYSQKMSSPSDDRVCNDNKLVFKFSDGKIVIPRTFDYMEKNSSPEMVYCAVSKKDRDKYIVITYSSGPSSCGAQCHQAVVFKTTDGSIYPEKIWQKIWQKESFPVGYLNLSIEGR